MWFPYALTFALISSVGLLLVKRILKEADIYLYLFWTEVFTSIVLFCIIKFLFQFPSVDKIFYMNITIAAILDIAAAILASKAIKIREISLLAPVSAFNPVFTAIISYFSLGEKIAPQGIVGILLVCVGAYLLQLSEVKKGIMDPIKAFLSDKGILLILAAYFIWAITPIFQKTAILHTLPNVPPFSSLIEGLMILPVYFVLVMSLSSGKVRLTKKLYPWFVSVGLLAGVGSAAGFMVFNLTSLGIATAVFKLSMIFSVILGWIFFKEHSFKERILGSSVMLAGVLLLVK